MIKLPFHRKLEHEDRDQPSVAFARYCQRELERRRDSGARLDEERFGAAVDLAVDRLRGMEGKGEA